VARVEDVLIEVGADGHRLERYVAEVHERLGRKVRLGDGVVLEVKIGSDLE
jgi:hypothetical protein